MTNDVTLEHGWKLLLADLDVEANLLVQAAALPDHVFDDDERRLPIDAFFRLWDALESLAESTTLPIYLAHAMTAQAFNPMLFACLCSPNMHVAMQRMATYKRITMPAKVSVKLNGGTLRVSKSWNSELPVPRVLELTQLTSVLQIARMGTRHPIEALEVTVPFDPIDVGTYADFFGCPVQRGDSARISINADDALRPFLTANHDMWKAFEPEMQRRLSEIHAESCAARTASVLLESIPSGETTMAYAAARLGMSTRSLQRRLREEETTYSAVLAQTRLQLAKHYLTNTDVSYQEIAFLLGFDEPSSFYRAFRQWTGTTPESTRYNEHGAPQLQ